MSMMPSITTDFMDEQPPKLDDESSDDEPLIVEKIEQDIFVNKPTPAIKVIVEDLVEPEFVDVKPKPVKKKRVMTQKQLDQLTKNREKALASRRAKALDKQELKDLEAKARLKKKQTLQQFVDEPISKVVETPTPSPAPAPIPKPIREVVVKEVMPTYDIEAITSKAVANALQKHEDARKARKAVKKAKQAEDDKDDDLLDMVFAAQRRPSRQSRGGYNGGGKGFFG